MLMRVENQLERQIDSSFYERFLSSHDKEAVNGEILSSKPAKKPKNVIRDPYIPELLGMKQSAVTQKG